MEPSTARTPERAASRLALVADLSLEVGDARGSTTAHLGNGANGLVLDAPDLTTLLRCLPGRGLRRDLPISVPLERFSGVQVDVTSHGRRMGRVDVTSSGSARLRPAVRALPQLVRQGVGLGVVLVRSSVRRLSLRMRAGSSP